MEKVKNYLLVFKYWKISVVDLKVQVDTKWSLLSLEMPEQIEPQKAQLDLVFNGEIRNELEGFYRFNLLNKR